MATRRSAKSKKVSFNNSSKIVEIDQEEIVNITSNSDGKIVDAEIEISTKNNLDDKNKNNSNNNNKQDFDDDDFDPDKMDIDLTTGKKRRGIKTNDKEAFTVETLSTSLTLIPWHLPILLITMLTDGQLMAETKEGLQKGFNNIAILGLIYCVMVGEIAKCEKNPSLKSNGPTALEFLYTAISFPFSILLSIPIYLSFLLFGAPAGPLTAMTFYLAAHVSLIVFFPLLNVYKLTDKDAKIIWKKLLTFQLENWKLNQVYCTSIGGLVGCWLGVIPIPLDWDRDWQDWPITLLIGAYGGAFIGGLSSYIYGKYVLRSFRRNA